MAEYEQTPLIKSNQAYNQGGLGNTYMDMQRRGGAGALNTALSNSEWGQTILDPIDLFGSRAALAQANLDIMAKNTAMEGLKAQRDQYYKTQELQQPFYDLGMQGLGNFGNYQQGPTFQQDLNEGARQLRGSANAAGLGNSSAAGRNLSQFVGQLTQDDMNRQYQQNLNNVRIGQGAVGQIGAAGQAFGGAASNIYGNFGQQSAQNALNYGQQRSDTFNTLGQAAQGLGSYLDYQGSQ